MKFLLRTFFGYSALTVRGSTITQFGINSNSATDRYLEMQADISEFRIDDYQEVIALWKSCEGIGLSGADSKDDLAAYLKRNPGMSFVAKRKNAIVAAVLCGHDGRRGYLHHLAVHPDFRNQGIGRALVESCISALKSVGIQKCHLFIFNSNREAIHFWGKIGWSYRKDIGVISQQIQ